MLRTEHAHRIGVGFRDSPAFRRDDVMRNSDTALDGREEVVLHRRKPGGILKQIALGAVLGQSLQVRPRSVEQPVEQFLINHAALRWPTRFVAGGSARGSPGSHPGSAAGYRPATGPLPADHHRRASDPPALSNQPKRCAIEYDQIHADREVHLPGCRRSGTPPRAHIQVAVRTRAAAYPAAVDERKPCTRRTEHLGYWLLLRDHDDQCDSVVLTDRVRDAAAVHTPRHCLQIPSEVITPFVGSEALTDQPRTWEPPGLPCQPLRGWAHPHYRRCPPPSWVGQSLEQR